MDISVVTVSYNAEDTIKKTIQSVARIRGQADVEYIVIDGDSTDGTVDRIQKHDNVVDHWISEPDRGIYDAMNKGIDRATGEWIGILNSDDWYHEEVIDHLDDTIEEALEADIIIGQMILMSEDLSHGRLIDPPTLPFDCLKPNNHPATFVRKSVYEKVGRFDLQYPIAADLDFLLRAQSHTDVHITRCPSPLTYMRMGGNSYGFGGMVESGLIEAKYHGGWSGTKVAAIKTAQKARRWFAQKLLPKSLFHYLRKAKWSMEDGKERVLEFPADSAGRSV